MSNTFECYSNLFIPGAMSLVRFGLPRLLYNPWPACIQSSDHGNMGRFIHVILSVTAKSPTGINSATFDFSTLITYFLRKSIFWLCGISYRGIIMFPDTSSAWIWTRNDLKR